MSPSEQNHTAPSPELGQQWGHQNSKIGFMMRSTEEKADYAMREEFKSTSAPH
jgi:hypothetical protein